MSTKILGLRTTIYKTNDIANAKEWYTKAFNIQTYFDEPFYAGFNIAGFELSLQPEETPISKSDAVVSYWSVENNNEKFDHFLHLGLKIHEAPQNVGGEIVVATLKDSWNNIKGLLYNPSFKIL